MVVVCVGGVRLWGCIGGVRSGEGGALVDEGGASDDINSRPCFPKSMEWGGGAMGEGGA